MKNHIRGGGNNVRSMLTAAGDDTPGGIISVLLLPLPGSPGTITQDAVVASLEGGAEAGGPVGTEITAAEPVDG